MPFSRKWKQCSFPTQISLPFPPSPPIPTFTHKVPYVAKHMHQWFCHQNQEFHLLVIQWFFPISKHSYIISTPRSFLDSPINFSTTNGYFVFKMPNIWAIVGNVYYDQLFSCPWCANYVDLFICPHLLSSCQYLVIHDLCIDWHNKALWHIQKFLLTHHANSWKCFVNDFVLIISRCPLLAPIVLMVQLKIPCHIMFKYPFTKWPPHTIPYPS